MPKNLSEWIIGSNPAGDRWFVLHAAEPWFCAEIADADEERSEAILDSFSYGGGGYDLFNFRWIDETPPESKLMRLLARCVEAIGAHDNQSEDWAALEAAPSIGAKIKAAREQAGLTQMELAAAAGTHQSHVARIELGQQTPTLEVLSRLAHAVGVDLGQLLPD